MSGIVKTPKVEHSCAPGWTYDVVDHEVFGPSTRFAKPPRSWDYPRGTVWECDCKLTWVSLGAPDRFSPGLCGWKLEGLFARWRRTRRTT